MMRKPQTETVFTQTVCWEKAAILLSHLIQKKKDLEYACIDGPRNSARVRQQRRSFPPKVLQSCLQISIGIHLSSLGLPLLSSRCCQGSPCRWQIWGGRTKLLQTYRRTQKRRVNRRRDRCAYLTVHRTWWDPARPAPGRRWRRCTWGGDKV